MDGIMTGPALGEGLESLGTDYAEGCLKYFKDGERQLGGSGD
jgi:hypothetical protein